MKRRTEARRNVIEASGPSGRLAAVEARLAAVEFAVAALALRLPGGEADLFDALPAGSAGRFEAALGGAWEAAPADLREAAFRSLDEIGRAWTFGRFPAEAKAR